jgi:hypothetical protein
MGAASYPLVGIPATEIVKRGVGKIRGARLFRKKHTTGTREMKTAFNVVQKMLPGTHPLIFVESGAL